MTNHFLIETSLTTGEFQDACKWLEELVRNSAPTNDALDWKYDLVVILVASLLSTTGEAKAVPEVDTNSWLETK